MIYLEIVGGWVVLAVILGMALGIAMSDDPHIRRRGR